MKNVEGVMFPKIITSGHFGTIAQSVERLPLTLKVPCSPEPEGKGEERFTCHNAPTSPLARVARYKAVSGCYIVLAVMIGKVDRCTRFMWAA